MQHGSPLYEREHRLSVAIHTCLADLDLVFYGLLMAGLTLANFAITIWGYFDGYLGYGCNEALHDGRCDNTGQARSACFSAFLIMLMGQSASHWVYPAPLYTPQ